MFVLSYSLPVSWSHQLCRAPTPTSTGSRDSTRPKGVNANNSRGVEVDETRPGCWTQLHTWLGCSGGIGGPTILCNCFSLIFFPYAVSWITNWNYTSTMISKSKYKWGLRCYPIQPQCHFPSARGVREITICNNPGFDPKIACQKTEMIQTLPQLDFQFFEVPAHLSIDLGLSENVGLIFPMK